MKVGGVQMGILAIILSIIFVIVCISLIVIILLQSSRNAGLSGTISGMGETYWGKNKANSMEGKLETYTKILSAAFIIIAILLNVVIR
jgi:preprotein translocase subunit SecG